MNHSNKKFGATYQSGVFNGSLQENESEIQTPVLYISHFSRDYHKQELYKLLSFYGKVVSLDVYSHSKIPVPYAFVEYDDLRDACDARTQLNHQLINNFRLNVQFKKPRFQTLASGPAYKNISLELSPVQNQKNPYSFSVNTQILLQYPNKKQAHKINDEDRLEEKKNKKSTVEIVLQDQEEFCKKKNSRRHRDGEVQKYERISRKHSRKEQSFSSSLSFSSSSSSYFKSRHRVRKDYKKIDIRFGKAKRRISRSREKRYAYNTQKQAISTFNTNTTHTTPQKDTIKKNENTNLTITNTLNTNNCFKVKQQQSITIKCEDNDLPPIKYEPEQFNKPLQIKQEKINEHENCMKSQSEILSKSFIDLPLVSAFSIATAQSLNHSISTVVKVDVVKVDVGTATVETEVNRFYFQNVGKSVGCQTQSDYDMKGVNSKLQEMVAHLSKLVKMQNSRIQALEMSSQFQNK